MRSVKPRGAWVVGLCAVAALVVPASAGAITSAECAARVNDTPSKLVECIQQGDLSSHMDNLQAIANANPGPDGHPSRNSGEPGYKASADYVAQKMQEAGYKVTMQKYQFPYSAFVGTPSFTESGAASQDFKLVEQWNPGSIAGHAEGDLQPAGGIVIPPDPAGSTSTSGCTSADFSGFTAGNIALIQR